MGFVTGSSWFLHSPPFPFSSSSSSCSPYPSQFAFLHSCARNAETKKKNKTAMACMHHDSPDDSGSRRRRAIMLVGFSILPLLQLNARARDSLAPEVPKVSSPEDNQKAERTPQGVASPNPLLSLLNGIGIFSAGVLGALYALAQKERRVFVTTMESVKNKLKEKEAAIVSLEKKFESKLLKEQEDRNKQLRKAREEQHSLIERLNSANTTINGLGQEFQREKRLSEELKVQNDGLQIDLSKIGEDKKELEEKLKDKLDTIEFLEEKMNLLSLEIKDKEDNVHKLSSTLAEKDIEFENLKSIYEQIKVELEGANSEIKGLKDELLKSEKELELKNTAVGDLKMQVSTLTAERDDCNRKIDTMQKEYSDLKFSSEKKVASDAKLLGERQHELKQLREQLQHALSEVNSNQEVVADLSRERDDIRKMLNIELDNVKNLKHELQVTEETLGKSKNEVSDLTRQLQQSRNLCGEIEAEVYQVRADFAETKELLQRSLDEAKQSGEVLASELASAKQVLKKTKDELQNVSSELAITAENRDGLQKELVEAYKKVERAANNLKEEKKIVDSLKKDLEALEKQISKDKESKRSLEIDLEEAIKSLGEMNRNALILTRDLEATNSLISRLEDEKEILQTSLAEQKQVSQETQESLEDAHNLVMRLGKEREKLEKRAKKLEEELATAKGEILRLRSQINSSKPVVNDQPQRKGESEGNSAVPVKTTRRRKRAQ